MQVRSCLSKPEANRGVADHILHDEPPTREEAREPFPKSRILIWGGSALAIVSGMYVFQLGYSISHLLAKDHSNSPSSSSHEPTTPVYNITAQEFDASVDSVEYWQGITSWRRKLTRQLFGDVLEVAVGTGRNSHYYDLKNCTTVTMIDESGPMLEIARKKWAEERHLPEWREETPETMRKAVFRQMSAADNISLPLATTKLGDQKHTGFTCVLSTFSLCSLPQPAETLAHLCSMLSPPSRAIDADHQPRVFLLEHGRSYYNMLNRLLDASASDHAKVHGCWWNKDIGAIAEKAAEETGMEIVSLKRKHFGTTWIIEMRQNPELWEEKRRMRLQKAQQLKALAPSDEKTG